MISERFPRDVVLVLESHCFKGISVSCQVELECVCVCVCVCVKSVSETFQQQFLGFFSEFPSLNPC